MAKRPVKKASEKQVEGQKGAPANKVKKQTCPSKNTPTQKKKPHKLTRAEYYDLCQIDWVPFDPYVD